MSNTNAFGRELSCGITANSLGGSGFQFHLLLISRITFAPTLASHRNESLRIHSSTSTRKSLNSTSGLHEYDAATSASTVVGLRFVLSIITLYQAFRYELIIEWRFSVIIASFSLENLPSLNISRSVSLLIRTYWGLLRTNSLAQVDLPLAGSHRHMISFCVIIV